MKHLKRIETPVYKSNFWNNLRREREVTFQYIANILGISATMVRYYFIGARMPKPEHIKLMCEGFNVDIDQGTEEFKKIHKDWKANQAKKKSVAKVDKTSNPIVVKEPKVSTTSGNFWRDVKASAGATYPQIAKAVGCHSATVGAFFSGFVLPKADMIARICKYFGVDVNVGTAEFEKLFNDFGVKNQDKYVRRGNSYKVKSNITGLKRNRKSGKATSEKSSDPIALPDILPTETNLSKYMEAIYGVVSYELYTSVYKTCDTLDKLLSCIYGEVDYDLFREIENL